jgi:hypothetical protein
VGLIDRENTLTVGNERERKTRINKIKDYKRDYGIEREGQRILGYIW